MPLKRARSPSKYYEDDDPCFYADFKDRFMKEMKEIFGDSNADGGKIANVHPCTRREVEKLIEILQNENNPSYAKVRHLYALRIGKDEEYILTLENGFGTPFIQVLGYEDAFDHLFRIHVENKHHSYSNMVNIINKKYHIPLLCIKKFVKLCQSKYFCRKKSGQLDSRNEKRKKRILRCKYYTVTSRQSSEESLSETEIANSAQLEPTPKSTTLHCTLNNQNNKHTFNTNVYVHTLYISPNDGDFTHVLIYYDCETHFQILKPLMGVDVDEVCLELMKIFADFGTPLMYTVYDAHETFFKKVFNQLQEDWRIYVNLHSVCKVVLPMFKKLSFELHQWMKKTNCSSWGLGCRVVQWTLNKRQGLEIGNSHFYIRADVGSRGSVNNRSTSTSVVSKKPPRLFAPKIQTQHNIIPLPDDPKTSKTVEVANFETFLVGDSDNEMEDTSDLKIDVMSNILSKSIQKEELWLKEDINSKLEMTYYDVPENIPQEKTSFILPEMVPQEVSLKIEDDVVDTEAISEKTSFILPEIVPQEVSLKIEDDVVDTEAISDTALNISIAPSSTLDIEPTIIPGVSVTPMSYTITNSEDPVPLSPTKLLTIERPDITVVVCHECSVSGTMNIKCQRCNRKVHKECSAPFVIKNDMGVVHVSILCHTCKSTKELQALMT